MLIDLLQPKNIYAAPEGKGQVYMPTSLLTAGARISRTGVMVKFHDQNLHPYTGEAKIIGINLLGAPYIWKTIQIMTDILNIRPDVQFLLGGQVIDGLLPSQFERLFGKFNAVNGNIDSNIAQLFNINEKELPSPESISLIPMYESLDNNDLYDYLNHEFSFYLSQGCKFACEFCAAVRSRRENGSGKLIRAGEVYRDFNVVENDLNYLMKKSLSFGFQELRLYLSNLDLFQSPSQLIKFARICNLLKERNPGFKLRLRGLSTPDSFLRVVTKYPSALAELSSAGLETVGFGIDGMTPEVWKKIKKSHNSKEKCVESIRIAREYGIITELLMTFGHNDADTEESLSAAYDFTKLMIDLYGAVPRPHIAKSFIPGNDGWNQPENFKRIESLIKYPNVFQSLDFCALPTAFTHSNRKIRSLSKKYFLMMCNLKGNTTQYVQAFTPNMSGKSLKRVETFNLNKFDR